MRAFGRGKGNQVRILSDPVTVSRKVCLGGHCVMYVRRRTDEGAGGSERLPCRKLRARKPALLQRLDRLPRKAVPKRIDQ